MSLNLTLETTIERCIEHAEVLYIIADVLSDSANANLNTANRIRGAANQLKRAGEVIAEQHKSCHSS
jgi:hypothetical protein